MKIIHFSDPHLGLWPRGGSSFFDKRLVGALNYFLFRRSHFDLNVLQMAIDTTLTLKPQVVVISGDITSTGTPEEFELACEYLKPLVEADLKLIYIPGNHDAYVQNKRCVNGLKKAFSYLNQGRWQLDELPLNYKLGDVTFQILNEAFPTPPYRSSGVLTSTASELISTPKKENTEVRIGVGHFPVRDRSGQPLNSRRCLKNSQSLYSALEESRLDAYLCGHIHKPFINNYGSTKEICAGSISQNGHLNVLEINQVNGTLEQHWEVIKSDPSSKIKIKSFCIPELQYSGSQAALASGACKINSGPCNKMPVVNGDQNE
ncbi:MAG: metallophosphoesterase [Lentisphaeria bacterium]|nr:metallophosphoesterase [Lentisphaeria bacterium]